MMMMNTKKGEFFMSEGEIFYGLFSYFINQTMESRNVLAGRVESILERVNLLSILIYFSVCF
jgi:hypothetical protein